MHITHIHTNAYISVIYGPIYLIVSVIIMVDAIEYSFPNEKDAIKLFDQNGANDPIAETIV